MKIFIIFIFSLILLYPISSFSEDGFNFRQFNPLVLRQDDAPNRKAPQLAPGSQIKIYIPSLPYIYISHAINGALLRPANNARGWEFDLATEFRQIDETTYEFKLRKDVRFQDSTPFNAHMVVLNMDYFKKKPFLFSKIDSLFDHAEAVNDNTVRFYLKEKYGQFLNDLIWVEFYSPQYLKKYGWNGKATCPNLAEAGLYGIGPYILKEGYIEGDRQTSQAILEANPLYWNSQYPKIQKIVIYTDLDTDQALKKVLYEEGELDMMPISFSRKVETVLSPYAKVIAAPSTNNWAIHFNLRNGNKRLLEKEVRMALNQALHQQNLLNFVYDGEGIVKPTLASPLFPGIGRVAEHLRPYSEISDPYAKETQERLKSILNGLKLKVFTQDRFLFLWKGIEYQLSKVGVTLDFEITNSEKDIFDQLLTTNAGQNTKKWDLLSWGDDDWYFNHPWSAFLLYRTHNYWSSIFPDKVLDGYIDDLFKTKIKTPGFDAVVEKIMRHVYDNAYMLFVPAPNNVLAVNKEIAYTPYKMAILPLWEIEITKDHWSVRKGEYPEILRQPVKIQRFRVVDGGIQPISQ